MPTKRNREEGWSHAKRSGHKNEQLVKKLFDSESFREAFSSRLGVNKIVCAKVGGIHEKSVDGVLGRKTKSKTDLRLFLENGGVINISIKKSRSGQIAYQSVDNFLMGFEKQFCVIVPDDIKYIFKLYFFGNPDTMIILENTSIIGSQNDSLIEYQKEHNRLVWQSLLRWDKKRAFSFLQWFKDNIVSLTDYCFSKGLAVNSDEWADYVWFINLLGEEDLDTIYAIEDIKSAVTDNKDIIIPGPKNGGSTIWLPFGFAEWHRNKIQVHDRLNNLLALGITSF